MRFQGYIIFLTKINDYVTLIYIMKGAEKVAVRSIFGQKPLVSSRQCGSFSHQVGRMQISIVLTYVRVSIILAQRRETNVV